MSIESITFASRDRGRISRELLRSLAVLGAVITGGWAIVHFTVIRPTTPPSDTSRYETVIATLRRSMPATTHFPDSIPDTASNVAFYYLPHFMQGPTVLRLRLRQSPVEAGKLLERLRSARAPLSPEEREAVFHFGIPVEGIVSRRASSIGAELEPMPADFISFLIEPDLETARRNWNHPKNVGASISVSRSEVIYWVN